MVELTCEFVKFDLLSKEQLLEKSRQALEVVTKILDRALENNAGLFIEDGRVNAGAFNNSRTQRIAHAIAWLKTYADTLEASVDFVERLDSQGELSCTERLLLQTVMHEYIGEIMNGMRASSTETFSLGILGFDKEEIRAFEDEAGVSYFLNEEIRSAVKSQLTRQLTDNLASGKEMLGKSGLPEELDDLAARIKDFVAEEITPYAQRWHLEDGLIPEKTIEGMADIGVFGLTIPKKYGGSARGKLAMALSTEELASVSLAAGSVPTRSEIMAELLLVGGTDQQRNNYLPGLARGEIFPTIALTEPDAGSDLAALTTTATKTNSRSYSVDGKKLWNGHAGRADVIVLLARTDADSAGPKGISMFLLPKRRGDFESPSRNQGLTGKRILMPGYRGMGAYELTFEGFVAPNDSLLGEEEGQGFKHMMQAFEPARIQTAARATGVARAALEHSLGYAASRHQAGQPIVNFDRISDKIARMAAETFAVRQLTYKAALKKDQGERSDMEAGTAKMLAPRVAFDAASDGMQIFAGAGYRSEEDISRIFVDSKVLNIFEGAGEVQASIIARRMIEQHLEQ